ncbi:hypothetical protein COW36_13685 [bacterium (Candidatus Blackallbacteria) CG17_big_fil_post_rev_8_21_14_2_50_48_46]|uniref:Uncharacterized protein n=1 Tax=bacterium (Candidatus Blackallbacteria) CG17_big_fil_post_rev_8_21_14_2_50_48_46 TaxID=2014261 RepID=A0A2M7G3W3_9BACT|nr:MAG: hypothetical protein COW64_07290 [bacterium (Candidatus Blackallbacteria) CG18_big_fil_WC_8_21_14_2_50_49_26]PIW16180.1 MAG: hypothetical protein COW36_13685 [bacterium (Candidatus Blackallbacteria) CG17_big_fil_post_rev_8_21_14_2_50_48_46]PIW49938.1 MAG: hypothetical protein COW20_04620 [bacterium (Candidatus Blackallbacteria) CG13_big_fil_rev_8_21_14_2_50_49_14]
MKLSPSFETALTLFQQGQLGQAAQICQETLETSPQNAEAMHLLGLIDFQQGQAPQAADWIAKALETDPQNPFYHGNLASVLRSLGQYEEALKHARKALKKQENSPELHNNIGSMYQEAGQPGKARQHFREAQRLKPNFADAWYNQALLEIRQGQTEVALNCLEKLLKFAPDYAEAWFQRGLLLQTSEKKEQALHSYQHCYQLQPQHFQSICNAGVLLQALGRPVDAFHHYQKALEIHPQYAQAAYNLGTLFEEMGEFEKALPSYEAALRFDPGFVQAALNLSKVLLELNLPDKTRDLLEQVVSALPEQLDAWILLGNAWEALLEPSKAAEAYQMALKQAPHHLGARYNLAYLAQEQNQVETALQGYAEVLKDDPEFVQAHYNTGFLKLLKGEFTEGWEEYEWRWRMPGMHLFEQGQTPFWRGENLNKKHLHLVAEQGFGDTLQFVRYLPLLTAQGAQVSMSCQAEIKTLLEASLPEIELHALNSPIPPADYCLPLLSLPRVMQTQRETIPAQIPYLKAPESKTQTLSASGLKVGLVWSSGFRNEKILYQVYQKKSLRLEQFQELLGLSGASFYSLQKGVEQAEIEPLQAKFPQLHDLATSIHDFADTAAWMNCLDLIISVDTATAHLAGALGKPTWVLLPFSADWRWLQNRSDSPWYPSMRLFRQEAPGNWQGVLSELQSALKQKLATGAFEK